MSTKTEEAGKVILDLKDYSDHDCWLLSLALKGACENIGLSVLIDTQQLSPRFLLQDPHNHTFWHCENDRGFVTEMKQTQAGDWITAEQYNEEYGNV